jgi:DNA-binding response OmpR family regulator
VLAAWICSLDNSKELAKQVGAPYKIEEVLFPGDTPEDKERVESRILSLVRCYREMVANDPAGSRDVGVTRRSLRSAWSSSPTQQNLLELFLQILMDEQFLENLGQASGTILLVGPTEAATPTLGPALAADGYEILVARGGSEVASALGEQVPDLVIAEFEQEEGDGVKICQQLKKEAATRDVSLMMVMEEANAKRAAECLRAGADDFLTKPVNLELLFIRMERLMQDSADQVTEDAGVKGSLDDMSFTDMIQILSAGGKDVEIHLKRDDLEGEVFVQGGNVVHAALGSIQGEAAFFKLMRWTEGEFTTKQCSEPPEMSITVSTMSLLMEGARQADEGEEAHAAEGLTTTG